MKIKITFLFLSILLCSLSNNKLNAQETYLKNRWNVKLSAAPYATINNIKRLSTTADFRLEGNYGILNFLEVGVYMGYARYIATISDTLEGMVGGYYKPGHFLSYGINANLHIFPFFIKKPNFRFDLYVTAKYGGRSSLVSKEYKYEHEWAAGLGFAFYFSKCVGLFAEYSFGKFYIKDIRFPDRHASDLQFFPNKSTIRAGFSVKFKPNKK
jgi:hypothetical protein